MGSKNKYVFLELLRIIACFLVIVNHTNSTIFLSTTPQSINWYISIGYFYISKISVPIFFMISGYLLLSKEDSWKRSVNRILKMIIALVVCGIIYSAYNVYFVANSDSFLDVLKGIVNIYRVSPSNALWYLYSYIGILMMLPFLQKMNFSMKKIDYYVFFLISGIFFALVPILHHYSEYITYHGEFYIPLFSSYVCMLFIGQYFYKFKIRKTKLRIFIASITFIIMVLFNIVATYFEFYNNTNTNYLFFDNRTFLPIIVSSVCIFYLASVFEFPFKASKLLSNIGSCTFGIYLFSDLLISLEYPVFYYLTKIVHPILSVIVFEVIVFVSGLILTALLKKTPLIKEIL